MKVRFWGTRGSLAKAGPTTVRYGGNTSCVELRADDGTLVVFDCGTGAHGLGQELVRAGEQPVRGHLLITHTHWDHIQGLPFFAPLFVEGNEWDIYAPRGFGQRLEETLAGQMQYNYFPVTLQQLGAVIRYHDLTEGIFTVGSLQAISRYLNHPGLTLGYRVEAGGVSVVYATDHEPHSRQQAEASHPSEGAPPLPSVHREDQKHLEFLAGADLVIHDSQYTVGEYKAKVGWGHSTFDYVVDASLSAGAKRLALFHHDPLRDDDALERELMACRRRVAALGASLEVLVATEGETIELPERAGAPPVARSGPSALGEPEGAGWRRPARAAGDLEGLRDWLRLRTKLLIAHDDPEVRRLVTEALRPDGPRIIPAEDGPTALRLARAEHPALILLGRNLPGIDGLDISRALRADGDQRLRDVPVVLISGASAEEDMAAGFAAGVTDYLTRPFSAQYLRSRVRAWLMRSGAHTR